MAEPTPSERRIPDPGEAKEIDVAGGLGDGGGGGPVGKTNDDTRIGNISIGDRVTGRETISPDLDRGTIDGGTTSLGGLQLR